MIAREPVVLPGYAAEVERGLTQPRKSLPCKLFYDAAGSELFEQITRLSEYYLTRAEREILEQESDDIARSLGLGVTVIELGAGTAEKTCTLLHACARRLRRVAYVPVDISPAALAQARVRVLERCPGLRVDPVVADFADGFGFVQAVRGPKLVLYLGSSIGNFDPADAIGLLRAVAGAFGPGDRLLLGTDLAKDPAILLPAYDDAQGVTAEFNKNILRRLNSELGADFDPQAFQHLALWNPAASRMEIYLESTRAQVVNLGVLRRSIRFRAGERLHTENSYKYTVPMVCAMLSAAGLCLERTWQDARRWYALHLARVRNDA